MILINVSHSNAVHINLRSFAGKVEPIATLTEVEFMIVFDVKCQVLDPIHVSDSLGKDVTILPGHYHLLGLDHLVHKVSGQTTTMGTDLSFVSEGDGKTVYTVSAENLAQFIARDEVEVRA